ncbi:MAG: hypothetical protein WCK15_22935, partial [Pirellula sp.]
TVSEAGTNFTSDKRLGQSCYNSWALTPFPTKEIAGGIDYLSSNDNPYNHIRIPYISSPDWSRNLVTEERESGHRR